MALKDKFKKNLADWGATLAGLIVAIAADLILIDWANFNIEKEYPKIILAIIIAAGGYFSKFKTINKPKTEE